VHITGGLLLRRTKLVIVQYKNSLNSNSMEIFIKNRLVVYITAYYKNIGLTRNSKIIY
jgi:hypothetical protein